MWLLGPIKVNPGGSKGLSKLVAGRIILQQTPKRLESGAALNGAYKASFRADLKTRPDVGADSKKLECGPGTIIARVPSIPGCSVGGRSYSNFLLLLYL